MSPLGKILLIVAAVGGLAAAIMGGLLVNARQTDAMTIKQKNDAIAVAQQQAAKSDEAAKAAAQQASDATTKLTAATGQVSDLQTQLATAQKQASDANAALQTANANAQDAKDKLDAINKTLNGANPQDLVDAAAKAQSDLQAAQSEKQIIQDSLAQSQQKISDLMDALNRKDTGKMPGVSGKVTFVDRAWNFVILDVGVDSGVVPNGELIVYRGRQFLGKVRVTKVDPNDSVAEILPDIKGDIQIGDAVLN